jgi:hypothetical protein
VDRERSERNLSTALAVASLAILMFGLSFFAAIQYIG